MTRRGMLIASLVAIGLVGCGKTTPWLSGVASGGKMSITWSLPSETVVLSNSVAGRPDATCTIAASSDAHRRLAKWIFQNQAGWDATPVTYAPGVLVSGSNFSINFFGTSVILNIPEGQFAKTIAVSEYSYIHCPPST
jgi:hypothetical protein